MSLLLLIFSHKNQTNTQTYTNKKGSKIMVFNATFNNISVISWRSLLLVEETEAPGKNHWPAVSH